MPFVSFTQPILSILTLRRKLIILNYYWVSQSLYQLSSTTKAKPFSLEQASGKLNSQIKTPFFSKSYFEYAHIIVNDPSSFVPKNVTTNCSMLDLIFNYFKSISEYLNGLISGLKEQIENSKEKLSNEQMSIHIKEVLKTIDENNVLGKVLGLKRFEDCIEDEDN